MRNAIERKITDEEADYVRQHHGSMSVVDMAKHLHMRKGPIYDFMEKEGLQTFRGGVGGRKLKERSTEFFDPHERDWMIGN